MSYTPLTQYTEGDVDATITGDAILWEDAAETLVAVSAAKPLPVGIVSGGGGAVTVADGADVTQGATTDAAVASDTTGTVSGKLRGLVKIFASVWDSVNGRLKVDGSGVTQPVSGTVSASQSGTWTVQPGNTANTTAWKVDGSAVTQPVSGTVAVTNANLDAGLSTLLTTSDFDTKAGSLTETAPATDTASSGLNGRLQRIAQRLTSLIALLPTALVSNRLDVNLGAAPATVTATVSGTVAVSSITTAVVPGTAATHLGKAEDDPHTSGDTGVMALAVRNDTIGTLAGTDGDYAPLQLTSVGGLRVDNSASTAPVDRSSSTTFTTVGNTLSQSVSGYCTVHVGIVGVFSGTLLVTGVSTAESLQLTGRRIDDGLSYSSITQGGIYQYNCSGYSSIQVTANSFPSGSATVEIRASTGIATVRIDSVGTNAADIGKAEDAAHTSGDTGVMALGVRNDTRASLAGTDGDYAPFQTNSSGDVRVAPSAPASTITAVDLTTIADATRVVTLLAANISRRGAVISNDTDATLYIKEGAAASLTSYTDILPPGCRYLMETTSILTAYAPVMPSGRILVTERA